jgi:hypothetical protein
MNTHRWATLTLATILGLIAVCAFAPAASAQGAGLYELVGAPRWRSSSPARP